MNKNPIDGTVPTPTLSPAQEPAPAPEPAPTAIAAEPVKKKKTGLIVSIIALIVLIGGGVAAYFFLFKKSPVDTVAAAAVNTVNAYAKNEGNLDINGVISFANMEVTLDAKIAKDKSAEAHLDLASMAKLDLVLKDSVAYFNTEGLGSLLGMIGSFGLPSEAVSAINLLDGEWFYVEQDVLSDMGTSISFDTTEVENLDAESFKKNFNVEVYNGDSIKSKFGTIYKITEKEGNSFQGIDAVYVELKDDKVARIYMETNQEGIAIVFDMTITSPASIEITAPAGAKSLMEAFQGGLITEEEIEYDDDDVEDYEDDDDWGISDDEWEY